MQAALEEGYERIEGALLESWLPASGDDAAWRGNNIPALPPMTPAQALHLLAMHRKQVRWRQAEFARRLYPGETSDIRSARMARLYRAKLAADAQDVMEREVARLADRLERLAPPVVLPDLGQVTGWSKADPAAGGQGGGALFGSAEPGHLTEAQREAGLRKASAARGGGRLRNQIK